jgi:Cd2+/Zn2+-exporting ATPase
MGGIGSEAAIEAAEAVILNDSPLKVDELYAIARTVRKVVRQNIASALGIKFLIMVLGLGGLSGLWEAVFADVGVTLLAVLNVVHALRKHT